MYVPASNAETDPSQLHALIRAHPFGTWVRHAADGLIADHVPFLLDEARGPNGTLVGHVARANPVWREFGDAPSGAPDSLVIFQGAQGYVSPSWYAAKHEHGKVVPTWNYVVVQVHGKPHAIHDRDWLLRFVTRLTDVHEAARAAPWQVGDAPADYIDGLLGSIVGIEIAITRMVGKWKVSQNRSAADRRGVAAGLVTLGDAASAAMAALMQRGLDAPDR